MVGSRNNKDNALGLAGKVYAWILLVIFGGIVLHAPISVGLGTLWPGVDLLIKSWKEILMLVAGIIVLFILFKTKKMRLLRDPIIIAIGVYAGLHLLLLAFAPQGSVASIAGLAIDLRYLLFFGLVYIALRLYPNYRKLFIKVAIAGALIVLIFALLQVFVLPHDILKYLGYNADTISPYLTIDLNHDFIRINSTLRGPNPLGAYAGIVLTLVVAFITRQKITKDKRLMAIVAVLSVGGLVALWASYSRSAMIGAIIAIIIVLAIATFRKLSTKVWINTCLVLVAIACGFIAIRNTDFVSNVILHENPNGGSSVTSNQDHISSLQDGMNDLIYQPMGAGIGSTGSASLFGNNPTVIENQYLFIAHEVGWLGLMLFISIFISILIKLWSLRKDWLALGVFASGIGLAFIGLLLPLWVDDTVAIIWWGLAAVVVGSKVVDAEGHEPFDRLMVIKRSRMGRDKSGIGVRK